MNTIEIKTDFSGEELQVLMWELEAFCEGKRLPKPVLRQTDVSGALPLADILTMLINAHEELAKSKISMDDYTPISSDLASAKSKLYKLI